MNEYLDRARQSLFDFYQVNYPVDKNIAVKDICFDHLKNSRIIFKREIWESIQNISLTTQVDEKEIGFLLYGKEFLPNQVYFHQIVLSDAPLKSIETEFGKEITEDLKVRIEENLDERTVVAHGHSHPKISVDYGFFSLGDFSSYVELTMKVLDFRNKNMQLVGCLVTPDLPVLFIYFNPADGKFYDFSSIEVEE